MYSVGQLSEMLIYILFRLLQVFLPPQYKESNQFCLREQLSALMLQDQNLKFSDTLNKTFGLILKVIQLDCSRWQESSRVRRRSGPTLERKLFGKHLLTFRRDFKTVRGMWSLPIQQQDPGPLMVASLLQNCARQNDRTYFLEQILSLIYNLKIFNVGYMNLLHLYSIFNIYIYVFIFGCAGSLLLCAGFQLW